MRIASSAGVGAVGRPTRVPLRPPARRILIGEAFVDVDNEYAQEFIAQQKEVRAVLRERAHAFAAPSLTPRRRCSTAPRIPQKNAGSVARLDAELAAIDARQKELKKVLYGRFGKSINLEE